MRLRGSELVVKALEDEGVRYAFGIPGTHNTELYDALERSEKILPVLVTDEQCATFMADAVSRCSDSIGVANVVPGAGVTHGLSGVAEAYMDCIPMLLLTCGIRTDSGKAFQLHDMDQLAILKPIVKAAWRPAAPEEIYPTIRRAIRLARSGTPGPVAVEIPAQFYLLTQDVPGLEFDEPPYRPPEAGPAQLQEAAKILGQARRPAIYLGYGARGAAGHLVELAEKLAAPVVTTIQGKGVFPESHPLWLWNGFGASAPPFVRAVMDRRDALLAIGCRFGEVATASYGMTPPAALIHVDIEGKVLNRNYPAKLAIESDAAAFVKGLLPLVSPRQEDPGLLVEIVRGREALDLARRGEKAPGKVSAAAFFEGLQKAVGKDAVYVTDSGNGTFLAMEHLRLDGPGRFLGPIDYSCMGYATPGAVGAKFARPETDVVALAGDGALLMTGLELLTAAQYKRAPVVCVLRDGELGQIAQFQRTALNRDTCSVISPYEVRDFAKAVGAEYVSLKEDAQIGPALQRALAAAREGKPVMVEVEIDYSHRTYFTRGVVSTNFWRLPLAERFRMLLRAAARKLSPVPAPRR